MSSGSILVRPRMFETVRNIRIDPGRSPDFSDPGSTVAFWGSSGLFRALPWLFRAIPDTFVALPGYSVGGPGYSVSSPAHSLSSPPACFGVYRHHPGLKSVARPCLIRGSVTAMHPSIRETVTVALSGTKPGRKCGTSLTIRGDTV